MPRFESLEEMKSYITGNIKNSAVEAFTNFRLQNVVYGIAEFLAQTVQVHASSDFAASSIATTSLSLNWSAVDNASNYIIERSVDYGVTYSQIYSGALLTYSDSGLTTATNYYYRHKGQATSLLDSDWVTIQATTL